MTTATCVDPTIPRSCCREILRPRLQQSHRRTAARTRRNKAIGSGQRVVDVLQRSRGNPCLSHEARSSTKRETTTIPQATSAANDSPGAIGRKPTSRTSVGLAQIDNARLSLSLASFGTDGVSVRRHSARRVPGRGLMVSSGIRAARSTFVFVKDRIGHHVFFRSPSCRDRDAAAFAAERKVARWTVESVGVLQIGHLCNMTRPVISEFVANEWKLPQCSSDSQGRQPAVSLPYVSAKLTQMPRHWNRALAP